MPSIYLRKIIVLRHGEPDVNLGITQKGILQVLASARALKKINLVPDLIVPSYPLRTQKTAVILKDFFQQAALANPYDFLDVCNNGFSAKGYLSSLDSSANIILLSAHSETLSFFANEFLDDVGCAALFNQIPKNRILEINNQSTNETMFMPRTADALIFKEAMGKKDEESQKRWELSGFIADGRMIFMTQMNGEKRGKKLDDPYHLVYSISA